MTTANSAFWINQVTKEVVYHQDVAVMWKALSEQQSFLKKEAIDETYLFFTTVDYGYWYQIGYRVQVTDYMVYGPRE